MYVWMWIGGQLLSLVEADLSVSHDTIPIAGKNLIAMCNSWWRRIYLFSSQPIRPTLVPPYYWDNACTWHKSIGIMWTQVSYARAQCVYHMSNSPKWLYIQCENSKSFLFSSRIASALRIFGPHYFLEEVKSNYFNIYFLIQFLI